MTPAENHVHRSCARVPAARLLAFLLTLSILPSIGAAQQAIRSGTLREGTLSFDGRATMGDFTGTTTAVTGEMAGGPDLSAVRGWVEAPVQTLKTGNGKRDKDLNKSMESSTYPTIRFELGAVTPGETRGDTVEVTLQGTFRIHGVDREAQFPATVVLQPDAIRLWAETPMNLKDYKIGGLSKMLGMLKMHEDILVHIDIVFGQTPLTGENKAAAEPDALTSTVGGGGHGS